MNVPPAEKILPQGLAEENALLRAQGTLTNIMKAAKAPTVDNIAREITPELPLLKGVLARRKILEVLDPPAPSGIGPSHPAHDLVSVGARVLGRNTIPVRNARHRIIRHDNISRVETGADRLKASSQHGVKKSYKEIEIKARKERSGTETAVRDSEAVLRNRIWEQLQRFDKRARDAFLDLASGTIKDWLSAQIIGFYQRVSPASARYQKLGEGHFRAMLMRACPGMAWTHSTVHDMEAVINNSGTIRVRSWDVLVAGSKNTWSGTKSFEAGGRTWKVFYHWSDAEKTRLFTGETENAEGDIERVLLSFDQGGDLAHNQTGYENDLQARIDAFVAQLGG